MIPEAARPSVPSSDVALAVTREVLIPLRYLVTSRSANISSWNALHLLSFHVPQTDRCSPRDNSVRNGDSCPPYSVIRHVLLAGDNGNSAIQSGDSRTISTIRYVSHQRPLSPDSTTHQCTRVVCQGWLDRPQCCNSCKLDAHRHAMVARLQRQGSIGKVTFAIPHPTEEAIQPFTGHAWPRSHQYFIFFLSGV